jgi:hypothetical protein
VDRTNLAVDFTNLAVDRTNLAVDFTNLAVDFTNLAVDRTSPPVDRKGPVFGRIVGVSWRRKREAGVLDFLRGSVSADVGTCWWPILARQKDDFRQWSDRLGSC